MVTYSVVNKYFTNFLSLMLQTVCQMILQLRLNGVSTEVCVCNQENEDDCDCTPTHGKMYIYLLFYEQLINSWL